LSDQIIKSNCACIFSFHAFATAWSLDAIFYYLVIILLQRTQSCSTVAHACIAFNSDIFLFNILPD